MTVAHHRALLVERDGPIVRYRFYPEHVEHPEIHGDFDLDVRTGEATIVRSSDRQGFKIYMPDDACVARLCRKIRVGFEQTGMPLPSAFYIA